MSPVVKLIIAGEFWRRDARIMLMRQSLINQLDRIYVFMGIYDA
jgi:hypothetical protein